MGSLSLHNLPHRAYPVSRPSPKSARSRPSHLDPYPTSPLQSDPPRLSDLPASSSPSSYPALYSSPPIATSGPIQQPDYHFPHYSHTGENPSHASYPGSHASTATTASWLFQQPSLETTTQPASFPIVPSSTTTFLTSQSNSHHMTMPLAQPNSTISSSQPPQPVSVSSHPYSSPGDFKHKTEPFWEDRSPSDSPPPSFNGSQKFRSSPSPKEEQGEKKQVDSREARRKAIETKAANKRKLATTHFAKVLANRINSLPENGIANQLLLAADQMEKDGNAIRQLLNDKQVLQRKVHMLEAEVHQLKSRSDEAMKMNI